MTKAVLACFALAACGGIPEAAALPPMVTLANSADGAPVLRVSDHTVQVCRTPAGSSVPLCRTATLPAAFGAITRAPTLHLPAPTSAAISGIADPQRMADPPDGAPLGDPAGTSPASVLDMPLLLMFEADGVHADVCLFDGAVLRCARIGATIPRGITVDAHSLPDDYTAFTYARSPGVSGIPDQQGQAALRFQAAFNAAAGSVRSAATTHTAHGGQPVPMEGEGIPVIVVPSPGPSQQDLDAIPVVVASGSVDTSDGTAPRLPSRDPTRDVSLHTLMNPCVVSPILTVCIIGKRPPPPVDSGAP